ncbi:MAG: ferritin-like domain-containing protein [Actinobacteria bacterium]|nr:ferritin-like domain-containing protein [Actinomycetota bacterium]MBW3641725.1 ferritin-like domain-containing protein [Actinomycetota bacterium]
MRDVKSTLPALIEVRESRRGRPVDLDRVRAFNEGRRRLLRNGGLGIGALGARGLLGGGFGAALMGIVARPAHAQSQLDIQILQTAASLENLAVSTYKAALGLRGFDANATVVAFAQTTMSQHAEHGQAFNAQAVNLGGQAQNEVNQPGQAVVDAAELTDASGQANYPGIVELASTLEQVATQTYVQNTSMLEDGTAKELMASIMGVEAQHLATLRAVGALLAGGAPELITVKATDGAVDVARLPKAAGSVAFPEPFESTENAFPPDSGDLG